MKVFLRADASLTLGSGHVMRGLTLARVLAAAGCRVTFLCRSLPGNLIGYIGEAGFAVHSLTAANWQEDAAQTSRLIGDSGGCDWLIVDHYGLDRRWESEVAAVSQKLLVVDDLADRPHCCDVLLDQNYFVAAKERYGGLVPPHCRQLLGPSYAMLRPEFRQLRSSLSRESEAAVRRVLVFFGGSDPDDETGTALAAIEALGWPAVKYDVVVGAINARRDAIRARCLELPGVDFHCQTDQLARLMVAADCAIGAGGSTAWERCCLQLPTVVVTIADNQVMPMRQLAEAGAIKLYEGEHSPAGYAAALAALGSDQAARQRMIDACRHLYDGLGAERVAAILLGRTRHESA